MQQLQEVHDEMQRQHLMQQPYVQDYAAEVGHQQRMMQAVQGRLQTHQAALRQQMMMQQQMQQMQQPQMRVHQMQQQQMQVHQMQQMQMQQVQQQQLYQLRAQQQMGMQLGSMQGQRQFQPAPGELQAGRKNHNICKFMPVAHVTQ